MAAKTIFSSLFGLLCCLVICKNQQYRLPVLATRSDPARSTKCSFERRTVSLPLRRASSIMVNMQWLRDEAWFMGVSDMVRLVSPRKSCRQMASVCGL